MVSLDSTNYYFTPFIILLTLMLTLPIAALFYVGREYILRALTSPLFISSLAITLLGALIAALLDLALGLPTAYALSRNLLPRGLSDVVSDVLLSPMTIPHTVVGLSLLILTSPISPIPIIRRLPLVDTMWGLVAAYFVVSAPIAIGSMKQVIDGVDVVYEELALTMGLTRWGAFTKVVIPMVRRDLVTSYLLAWSRSVSEFGSIAILAYYVMAPPLINYAYPIPILVWYEYEVYGLAPALGYASASLLISIITLVVMGLISRGRVRMPMIKP
ncbi:ABC transporter permease subunit [Vulcanisaeta thermophila]|uniref:ABC transporter permease subunit n=1 Tax=Vulcanisaeta thermophila TaxID=867917 RepID=UPI000B07D1B7|nr:ABC transporter permease subunit [Vulcanisaeta thermophila]